jgi:hypothetical protein
MLGYGKNATHGAAGVQNRSKSLQIAPNRSISSDKARSFSRFGLQVLLSSQKCCLIVLNYLESYLEAYLKNCLKNGLELSIIVKFYQSWCNVTKIVRCVVKSGV